MNLPPLFQITLLATCCFILSCTKSKPDAHTEDHEIQAKTSCPSPPNKCPPLKGTSFQISEECAFHMKCKYEQSGYKFPRVLNNRNPLEEATGFLIDHGELAKILSNMNPNNTNSVYVMLGITDNNEPDVFFVQQSVKPGTVKADYKYYDFTSPCPTWCPQNMAN